MTDQERLAVAQELQLLLADYWYDVDTNWGRNAGGYYTEDAVFETNKTSYRGRKQIEAFYQYRLDRGPRVAVHGFTNFRVVLDGPDKAVCNWYLILFAHDGVPILESAPPNQIAQMTDTMVKRDGRWLIQHRKFDSQFEGGAPTTNPILSEE